jgi:hypothetical protein
VLLTKQFWGSLITTELVFMSVSGSSAVTNLNDATFQGHRICISEDQYAVDIRSGEIVPNPSSRWDTDKVRRGAGGACPAHPSGNAPLMLVRDDSAHVRTAGVGADLSLRQRPVPRGRDMSAGKP